MEVHHPLLGVGEVGEFVVVRREEGLHPQFRAPGDVFHDGPGERQPVVGGRSPADFVEEDQALPGGVVEDVGGLLHLRQEGGAAPGQVVGGADPGEDPVHDRQPGRVRRHEGARLRHDRVERHLAEESGLPSHVRPGEDHHERLFVEAQVVRDEGVRRQRLHHRVPAGDHRRLETVVDLRPHIPAVRRRPGETGGHIGLREGRRDAQDGGARRGHDLRQFPEQPVLEGADALFGAGEALLELLEFLGDVPLGVHQGLAAHIVPGDAVAVALPDLDGVAEDLVVADPQRGDAGARPLPALQVADRRAAVEPQPAQFVQLLGDPLPDQVPRLPDDRRGVLGDGRGDPVPERGEAREPRAEVGQHRALRRRERRVEPVGGADGLGDLQVLPGAGDPQRGAGAQTLQVRAAVERLAGLLRPGPFRAPLRHRAVPAADRLRLEQRLGEPPPEEPGAHPGAGPVEGLHQRRLRVRAGGRRRERSEDLQVPLGHRVYDHPAAPGDPLQRPDVRQARALGLCEVADRGPGGAGGRGEVGHAVRLQRGGAEVLEQGVARVFQIEPEARTLGEERPSVPGGDHRQRGRRLRRQDLPRAESGHDLGALVEAVVPPELGGAEVAGREIHPGGAQGSLCRGPVVAGGHQVGAFRSFEVRGVEVGGGGRHPGDAAAHRAAALPRRLHLFADGDPVAGPHQPTDVPLRRLVGNAGHRDGDPVAVLLARGDRQVERRGRGPGVLVEHLVEVAHAEEQERVRGLALQFQVLPHGRGDAGGLLRGRGPLPADGRLPRKQRSGVWLGHDRRSPGRRKRARRGGGAGAEVRAARGGAAGSAARTRPGGTGGGGETGIAPPGREESRRAHSLRLFGTDSWGLRIL